MACACKVNRQISLIEKHYGTNALPSKKTHIADDIKLFFKKGIIFLICIPFIPIMVLYTIIRKCFTKKPIELDKIFKIKK